MNYQKTSNHISIYYWYLSFWGLFLFNRPPVCEVCLNREVSKPWTGNSTDLGSVDYCYVDILYAPPHLCPPKGEIHYCPSSHAIEDPPICTCIGSSAHLGVSCLLPSIPKSLILPRRLLYKFSAHLSFSRLRPYLASPHHPLLPNEETSY